MNVLFLQDHGGIGGAQKSLLDLLHGFREIQAPVVPRVVVGESGFLVDALREAGVRTDVVPFPEYRKLSHLPKRRAFFESLSRICTEHQAVLIHGNTHQVAPWSALLSARLQLPSCCTVREIIEAKRAGKYRVGANDRVIAISRAVQAGIPSRRTGHVCQVYNAIRAPAFLEGKERALAALGLPFNPVLRVVYLGRLEPRKAPENLLEAVPGVLASIPGVEFVFIGGGQVEMQNRLRTRTISLGVQAQVRFLGELAKAPASLTGFDLFVLPSISEPLGRVTVEAMYARLPVIATAAGGSAEIVLNGTTGQLVPPGDPAALTAAILRYLQNPALRESHGKAGQARARELFAPDRNAQRVGEIYSNLLSGQRHPHGETEAK